MHTETAGWRTEPPAGFAPSDADVIERSVSDPASFGVIFDRHSDAILRYAHARLGPDLAEDVLAETFLAAFARRSTYDTARTSALPWLYGIAIRQIGRHRRAESRSRAAMARLPVDAVAFDAGDGLAERVDARALRPRLVEILSRLTGPDRELLLLIAWAGLTYEESAEALGLTVSAVRSRLHRIRLRTRRALGLSNPLALAEETFHG